MGYRQNSDIVCPYYEDILIKKVSKEISFAEKNGEICMIISSSINKSGRIEYLEELMKYIKIDSYGKLFNNLSIADDNGRDTKLNIYSKYKFVIAFENAIGNDYVTEKIYDPLLAGSVPVYLGANNIDEFIPGKHCFINVKDFKTPKELGQHISLCLYNEFEYMKYHEWRNYPLRKDFIDKRKEYSINHFNRLCNLLDEKY